MSAWAKPGAKCVCIKRGGWKVIVPGANLDKVKPAFGEVCIIESMNDGFFRLRGYGEYYQATQFRPLITRTQEQDVAAFRHHLVGAPVLEPQDA